MIEWGVGKPTHEVPAGAPRSAALGERTVCLPPAAEPEDASPLLSGEAGSDMYNAKSVLMYAAETSWVRDPRGGRKKRGNGELQRKGSEAGKAPWLDSHGSLRELTCKR